MTRYAMHVVLGLAVVGMLGGCWICMGQRIARSTPIFGGVSMMPLKILRNGFGETC